MQPQNRVRFSLTNSQIIKENEKVKKRTVENVQRSSKRSKQESENIESQIRRPQTFPKEVLKIIQQSLKSGLEALQATSWNLTPIEKNRKPSFNSLFNTLTGELYIVAPQELVDLPKNVVLLEFEYYSKSKVCLKREEFRKSLIEYKKCLSMTAIKILLAVEELLGGCHSFIAEECSLQETSETQEGESNVKQWTQYTGNLEKERIKALLANHQKIKEVWEKVSQDHTAFDKTFLLNLPYQKNELDRPWEPGEFAEGELLVVKRNHNTPTFALKQLKEPKLIKNDEVQVFLGTKIKNIKFDHLEAQVVSRW